MKRIFIIACLAVSAMSGYAQQDVLLSQYMFNQLLINPAYAGTKEYMMATFLYRNQWVNWDNAPTTQVASLHGPLGVSNFGWGGLIAHDHEGVTDRTDFYANASYHIQLNQKLKLSFGLRAGGAYWVRHNSDLIYWDKNDPVFAGNRTSSFEPNAGAGVFLYSNRFYAGLSDPEVISYDPTTSLSLTPSSITTPHQVRHYFLTSGYAFPVSADVVLKPSILVKYVADAPVEGDFNLNALFYNVLWLGGSYRTGDAFVAIVEVQLTKQWRLGYSYDFTTTDIRNYSNGSHEISLGYDFGYDIQKMKTPRYF